VKEDVLNDRKIYYLEYANRLFPWRWKRVDIVIVNKETSKKEFMYFTDKKTAQRWLQNFRLHKDPILADRYYS